MAFKTKTQQAVEEAKTFLRGLDSETRGVVISEMYGFHTQLVEEEVSQIREQAYIALPGFGDHRKESTPQAPQSTQAQQPEAPKKAKRPYNRRKPVAAKKNATQARTVTEAKPTKRPYNRRATTTATASATAPATTPTAKAKDGERRTRFGQRQMGTLFDAMLQVIEIQEKKQGYAERNDLLNMTKDISPDAKGEKERYDLIGSYVQILKKHRKEISNQVENGKEVNGRYVLTSAGRQRCEELKRAKVNALQPQLAAA